MTIEERNKVALASMKKRFQERLDTEVVKMTHGELVQYTKACDFLCDHRNIESYAQLACFLLQNLAYDHPEVSVVERYKTFNTQEGIKEVLSDWDSRFEMGK